MGNPIESFWKVYGDCVWKNADYRSMEIIDKFKQLGNTRSLWKPCWLENKLLLSRCDIMLLETICFESLHETLVNDIGLFLWIMFAYNQSDGSWESLKDCSKIRNLVNFKSRELIPSLPGFRGRRLMTVTSLLRGKHLPWAWDVQSLVSLGLGKFQEETFHQKRCGN